MVDLPRVHPTGEEKVGVVHSVPPQSSVTLGQIRAPYEAFANAMDQWGDGINSLGKTVGKLAKKNQTEDLEKEPAAKKGRTGGKRGGSRNKTKGGLLIHDDGGIPGTEGFADTGEEVTHDEPETNDGTEEEDEETSADPVETAVNRVAQMPDDHAYSRVVQLGKMVQAENSANQGIAGIRQQYAGDPQSFLAAASEYKDGLVGKFAEVGAAPVAEGLSHAVDHTVDTHFQGLLRDKHASDVSQGQQAVSGKLDELASEMQALALNGGVDDPKFKRAQADYRAMLSEAAGNHLFSFNEDALRAHLDTTLLKTKEAALIGGARRAFALGGEDRAQEFIAKNIAHFDLDDDEQVALYDKVSRDVELQAQKKEAEQRKIEDFHRDTIKAHTEQGFAKLATASLDQNWLDQNSQYIEPAALNSLQNAIYAPAAEVSAPKARDDLTVAAVTSPDTLPRIAADALADGHLSREDFGAVLDLANTVKEDQKKRPWLNGLRRDLTQYPDAVGEFGEYMVANPNATRAEVRAAATEIGRQYAERDYRKAVAALPLPRFAAFTKADFTPDKMPEVAERLRVSHVNGKLNDRDFLVQVDLLRKWRDLQQRAPEKV